jgi:A/G-specific adenine glycosylase
MLQQTQASRVVPVFRAFVRQFPSLRALAWAPRRDVVSAWSGLGYNRRAVSLHQAARVILADHAGRVPRDAGVLQTLPGVGPYTAAAVAALAYGEPVAAVDTNVRRIVARVRFGCDADDVAPGDIEAAASAWLDRRDPAAWNQALMDLGRDICKPAPRCAECPIARDCAFRVSGGRSPRQDGPDRKKAKQPAFEGSFRQVRGLVVRELTQGPESGVTVARLARRCNEPIDRVAKAVRALAGDGLVSAGPAALSGHAGGRVRLSG